jgi:radical SAM family uncharacterized protein/radical SAM-linked protein
VWCERAYAVAPDLEALLRERQLPMFSVESKTPLAEFDVVGFTLQYELSYTNILNMLELSGIPLRSASRDESHPILLGGGPCVFNPEPLAYFLDAFVMGDGEDVVHEIADLVPRLKGLPRLEQLRRLSEVEGVYVPALYPMTTNPDGTIVPDPGGPRIRKRVVADLNKTPYPTRYIVPFTEQAHDRVSLEVLRGCTQACRFCQAGMVTRPVRERKLPLLQQLQAETMASTGYEEVALSSLSTCDYSQVKELVWQSVAEARKWDSAVSLPSLRLDSFSVDLSDMVQSIRKTGITFAPEAATDRMRAVINKWIPDEELLRTTGEVYARGWDLCKLYFMIGLPLETDEDVLAIARLAESVLKNGKSVNPRSKVNLGVSTFVPKPHTTFQWDRQVTVDETLHKQRLLRDNLKVAGLKFGKHDAQTSYLEGIFSRGDRRVGDLLEIAHRLGCRFDGWYEHLDYSRWEEAFRQWGLDPLDYLRERPLEEPLPWDHIDVFVDKEYLKEDYQRSRDEVTLRDCRYRKCSHCGVIDEKRDLCVEMLKTSKAGLKIQSSWQPREVPAWVEPTPVQRIRFRFARTGVLRFLSNRELMNLFTRALRRSRLPVAYSQGFHPQPKMAFGSALPVGMESLGEYCDVQLRDRVLPADFAERLNDVLMSGLRVLGAEDAPLYANSLMSVIQAERYELLVPAALVGQEELEARVAGLLALSEIPVERRSKTKSGKRAVNVRPLIRSLEVGEAGREGFASVRVLFADLDGCKGKPLELVSLLLSDRAERASEVLVRKLDAYRLDGESLVPLLAGGESAVSLVGASAH